MAMSNYQRVAMVNKGMMWNLQYPLANIQKVIEHGPVEIVDLSIFIAWWFSIYFFCRSLPEGTKKNRVFGNMVILKFRNMVMFHIDKEPLRLVILVVKPSVIGVVERYGDKSHANW